MNGLDFFFSPSPTVVDTSTVNNNNNNNGEEDDDWGDFVESSNTDRNQNNSDSSLNQIESEKKKKNQAHWVTSRGPVPLSIFGEEEADDDDASVSSFGFSFSSKQNNGIGSVNRVANSNPNLEINGLISNLYRENGNDLSNSNRKVENSESMNWNPLKLDTERSQKMNSSSIEVTLDHNDDDDGWEFKTAESIFRSKVEQENVTSESVVVENTMDLSSSTNGTVSSFDIGKIEAVKLNIDRENGDDDSWDNGGWEFKVADAGERKTTDICSSTNGTGPSFDIRKVDAVKLNIDRENGDDDTWDNGGWEFKVADAGERKNNLTSKVEQENVKSEFVVVQNTTDLSSVTNGTSPSFDIGKVDAVKSNIDRENGDDDAWDNGGWEFKVADAGERMNGLTKKESNGWEFGFGFESVSATDSFQSNVEKEPKKTENGSIFYPSNVNVDSGGTSWAFNQTSLENGNEKEDIKVQTDKPKGVLPLSFFEDEKLETSDSLVHEDNLVSTSDFSVRDKSKAPSPAVSINDLISSLYSQVEEKNAVNLSEKSNGNGFVSVNAATEANFVNGEDDSWEFQGPKKTISDSGVAEGDDDFDSNWQFQGPSIPLKNSDVTEGVDEFDDDSWEFQGPTQLVKDDNGSCEYSVEIRIERDDYQDFYHKLKTELYCMALNHLETLKDARNLAADSNEEFQKCDGEINDLQNWLNNDVLINEVDLKSLQPRSSGITELYKALQEPKFQALDSEDLLSEKLLSAEKDWKSTIELLKHATLTLKILNLGSPEQQSKYASTWLVIASACAQELRHTASIWKQVIKSDVQDEILSKPQGKRYALAVGEIYRVVKILRVSTRLYKPWILLAPTSSNVLAVLDECVKLWLSSGLLEALLYKFNRQELDIDYSVDQLLESIKSIDEIDVFTLHTCIVSATSPTCFISGVNTDVLPGIKMEEWNKEHYLLPLANLWANLISRDPPTLHGHHFPTFS